MPSTYCPNCDEVITVNRPQAGSTVRCRECDTDLEVISTNPFEVDFPVDYEEDWDDDGDDQ